MRYRSARLDYRCSRPPSVAALLNAPDCYMEKIVVGPSCKDAVYLDAPVPTI